MPNPQAFKFTILIILWCSLISACSKDDQATRADANALYNEGKISRAIKIYERLAEQGDSAAMYNLGNAYSQSPTQNRNLRLAFDWYLKAANAGESDAYLHLGYLTINGTSELNEHGMPITRLRCHHALVTCNGDVSDTQWWLGKSLASGKTESLDPMLFHLSSMSYDAELWAWAQLAIAHDIPIFNYEDEVSEFEKNAAEQDRLKARLWAQELIALYGPQSEVMQAR